MIAGILLRRLVVDSTRRRVLAAIERIVNAEPSASAAPRPPEITSIDRCSLVNNDPEAALRVVASQTWLSGWSGR
jgi:hypothetical protein